MVYMYLKDASIGPKHLFSNTPFLIRNVILQYHSMARKMSLFLYDWIDFTDETILLTSQKRNSVEPAKCTACRTINIVIGQYLTAQMTET